MDKPFDFEKINTDLAKPYSDEDLLKQIKMIPLVGVKGWGLIAELCKRYKKCLKSKA